MKAYFTYIYLFICLFKALQHVEKMKFKSIFQAQKFYLNDIHWRVLTLIHYGKYMHWTFTDANRFA